MDIFAHGLWTYAATKAANRLLAGDVSKGHKLRRANRPLRPRSETSKPLNAGLATFWGIFPDLFAFTLPVLLILGGIALGSVNISDLSYASQHGMKPLSTVYFLIWTMPHSLYNISHSIFVFLLVFGILYLILKRPVWELGGWLLHLLIDIPSHSYQFYPTPILWPISNWKFMYGVSWANPWFMLANYSALLIVYVFMLRKKRA